MKGRRIPVEEGVDPFDVLKEPGDYYGPVPYPDDGTVSVWFLAPVMGPGGHPVHARCAMPPHTFRECPDGSLEIRASILVKQRWKNEEWTWHGFLDEGHEWRTV